MGAALLGRPSKSTGIMSYGFSFRLHAPSRATYAHEGAKRPARLRPVVAARAPVRASTATRWFAFHTLREVESSRCSSDRTVWRIGCVRQLRIASMSLPRKGLVAALPEFLLAAVSRFMPLVAALDSSKLSRPTVPIKCRLITAPRAAHRHKVVFAAAVHDCVYLLSLPQLKKNQPPFSAVVAKEPHPFHIQDWPPTDEQYAAAKAELEAGMQQWLN